MLVSPEEFFHAQKVMNEAFKNHDISVGCRITLGAMLIVDSMIALPEAGQIEVAQELRMLLIKLGEGRIAEEVLESMRRAVAAGEMFPHGIQSPQVQH